MKSMMYTRKSFLLLVTFVVTANALASPEPVKSGKRASQEEADDVSSKASRMTKLQRSKNEDSDEFPLLREADLQGNLLGGKTASSFQKESMRNQKEQDFEEQSDQQSVVADSDVFQKVPNNSQNKASYEQSEQSNLHGLSQSNSINIAGSLGKSQMNGPSAPDLQGRENSHGHSLSDLDLPAQYDQRRLFISGEEMGSPLENQYGPSYLESSLNDAQEKKLYTGQNHEESVIDKTDNQKDQNIELSNRLGERHPLGNQSQELLQSQSQTYDYQKLEQNIAQETQNNEDGFWENMVNEFQEDPIELGHHQVSAPNDESALKAVESQAEEQGALAPQQPRAEQLKQDLPSLSRQNEDRPMSDTSDSHDTAPLSSPEKYQDAEKTEKWQDFNYSDKDGKRLVDAGSSPTPRAQSWQDDESDGTKEYNDIYYDDSTEVSPSPSATQYQGYSNTETEDEGFEDDWYEDPNHYDDETEKSFKYDENGPDQDADEQNMQIIENDAEWDKGQGLFEEDVVDTDMIKKDKQPTAPSSMVLFYTWMIVAILIMVVSISTYQTRCRGLRISQPAHTEDRRSLLDHEYA